jgi:cell division protein ZapA
LRISTGGMREIRDSGKVSGTDRIAVMAALNIALELLRARKSSRTLRGEGVDADVCAA